MAEADWTAWVGRSEVETDRVEPWRIAALMATLDLPQTPGWGEPVPAPWYWLYMLPLAPTSQLGPDGHPRRGGFLPPIPLERRMWAGSRMAFHGHLRVGDEIERRSEILKVVEKEGKAGRMAFVTVRHEVTTPHGLAVEEEQDIVYLAMATSFVPPAPVALPETLDWRESRAVDPVLLFRFSALTFNGHRIHYDLPYAQGIEKYPGLVVHGPLQALLLFAAATARHPEREAARYDFRAVRPLFDFDRVTLSGVAREDGGLDLRSSNGDGHVAMQAAIHWR